MAKTTAPEITSAQDIKTTYLLIFDAHGSTPGDVVDASDGRVNMRYSREMFGVLAQAGLTYEDDETGDDLTFVVDDTGMDRDDAEAKIDAWLVKVGATTDSRAKTPTPKTKAPHDKMHDCYCGCEEQVPAKSFYRPGHDARHAGNVGRAIFARYGEDGFNVEFEWGPALSALPSDRLKSKATDLANRLIAKAEAKHAKANSTKPASNDPGVVDVNDDGTDAKEEGTIKVGKTEYVAVRYTATGEIEYFDGAVTKTPSRTAAKTFRA